MMKRCGYLALALTLALVTGGSSSAMVEGKSPPIAAQGVTGGSWSDYSVAQYVGV
jgi:hypothetical protein